VELLESGDVRLSDGSIVKRHTWVDYNDGAGLQLCGGDIYDESGGYMGHIDPPGPRGHKGTVGKPPSENT
jgi:hypothetical protein